MLGCGCPQNLESATLLEAALPEKTFEAAWHADSVTVFKVEKKLIEGTQDEYSNKLEKSGTLDANQVKRFKERVLCDKSYVWKDLNNELSYNPNLQFRMNGPRGDVTVVLDAAGQSLSFISLDGQTILPLETKLAQYLSKQ